jgi:hypothetical protein
MLKMRQGILLFAACGLAAAAHATRLDGPSTYAAGSNPRGLAVGDLNGDGKADVVVANFGSGTLIGQSSTAAAGSLQLYKGSEQGLQPWMTLPSGKSPRGLALADLNGDGRLDIAASFYDDGTLGVYLQQSDGSFAPPLLLAVGSHPVGVAAGQLGGKTVLAVANYDSNSVSIVQLSGNSLSLRSTLSVAGNPTDLKFYQRSGKATLLLVAVYSANQLSRLTLNDDGSLAHRVDTALSGQPCKVVVADLNADGYPDAAVAQFTESKVTVFLGKADGSLSESGTATVLRGLHPNGLAYGALGATGRLVAADRDSDQADLLAWTPQGLSSTAALTVPDAQGNTGASYGPIEAAVGDVNGDGLDDLVLTHMRSDGVKLFLQRPAGAPEVSSPSHPDPKQWFPGTEAVLSWQPATDLDPIRQYLTVFDQQVGSFPQLGQGTTQNLDAHYPGLASGTYFFHVRAVDAAGRLGDTTHFKIGVTASLSKENVYNYPNPSRDGRTVIRFPLLQPAAVAIRIYDETGALVWSRDLAAGDTVAGVNAVEWDGHNGNGQVVGNGGYIYTLTCGSFSVTKKIAIVR